MLSIEKEDGATEFKEAFLEGATLAVTKFSENFFMAKQMEVQSSNNKVE